MGLVSMVVVVNPFEDRIGLEKNLTIIWFRKEETIKDEFESTGVRKPKGCEVNVTDSLCHAGQSPVLPKAFGRVLDQQRVESDSPVTVAQLDRWEIEGRRSTGNGLFRAHEQEDRLRVHKPADEPRRRASIHLRPPFGNLPHMLATVKVRRSSFGLPPTHATECSSFPFSRILH
jgi:hypothetical protein